MPGHTCREGDAERAPVGTALDVRVDGELLGVLLSTLEEQLDCRLISVLGSKVERSPALTQISAKARVIRRSLLCEAQQALSSAVWHSRGVLLTARSTTSVLALCSRRNLTTL